MARYYDSTGDEILNHINHNGQKVTGHDIWLSYWVALNNKTITYDEVIQIDNNVIELKKYNKQRTLTPFKIKEDFTWKIFNKGKRISIVDKQTGEIVITKNFK